MLKAVLPVLGHLACYGQEPIEGKFTLLETFLGEFWPLASCVHPWLARNLSLLPSLCSLQLFLRIDVSWANGLSRCLFLLNLEELY